MANKQVVWNTQMVDEAIEKIQSGFILKKIDNPFFEGIVGMRRAGLTFEFSDAEYEEYVKCALDIQYFSEKYCYVKGEDGQPVKIILRDYQKEILDNFTNHRFNILLSARQAGKCYVFNSISVIKIGNKYYKTRIGKLYYFILSQTRKLTMLEKLKIKIYDIIYALGG